ncbi:hypothetical protein MXZ45_004439 [Salmonella enterica]|nr:hypothetical protein [Salmonella enterica]EJC0345942.1 hypothetical protein [Salmonella enterica]EJC0669250.1 hypothetical protein [Salmonella enterica]
MRFSTKKAILAIVLCSSFTSVSVAMAAGVKTNSVSMHFVGAVTSSTCDVRPFNSAGVDATTINVGTMAPGGGSTDLTPAVSFYLKPVNCDIQTISSSNATIMWASSGLSTIGLLNTRGTATGVYVKLTPVNETGANPVDTSNGVQADGLIKEGMNTVYYKAAGSEKLTGNFAYKVGLARDSSVTTATPGTVDADAIYTVAYN